MYISKITSNEPPFFPGVVQCLQCRRARLVYRTTGLCEGCTHPLQGAPPFKAPPAALAKRASGPPFKAPPVARAEEVLFKAPPPHVRISIAEIEHQREEQASSGVAVPQGFYINDHLRFGTEPGRRGLEALEEARRILDLRPSNYISGALEGVRQGLLGEGETSDSSSGAGSADEVPQDGRRLFLDSGNNWREVPPRGTRDYQLHQKWLVRHLFRTSPLGGVPLEPDPYGSGNVSPLQLSPRVASEIARWEEDNQQPLLESVDLRTERDQSLPPCSRFRAPLCELCATFTRGEWVRFALSLLLQRAWVYSDKLGLDYLPILSGQWADRALDLQCASEEAEEELAEQGLPTLPGTWCPSDHDCAVLREHRFLRGGERVVRGFRGNVASAAVGGPASPVSYHSDES